VYFFLALSLYCLLSLSRRRIAYLIILRVLLLLLLLLTTSAKKMKYLYQIRASTKKLAYYCCTSLFISLSLLERCYIFHTELCFCFLSSLYIKNIVARIASIMARDFYCLQSGKNVLIDDNRIMMIELSKCM